LKRTEEKGGPEKKSCEKRNEGAAAGREGNFYGKETPAKKVARTAGCTRPWNEKRGRGLKELAGFNKRTKVRPVCNKRPPRTGGPKRD